MGKYVDNKDLRAELKAFETNGIITTYLHEMLHTMTKRISFKSQYKSKTYRDDMVSAAYIKCIRKAHKFDLNKNNPFAYFQSVIENRFKDYIHKTNRDKVYHAKLSSKLHHDNAMTYNLRQTHEEFEVVQTYDESHKNLIFWKASFLKFLNSKSPQSISRQSVISKIKNYFIEGSEQSIELLSSDNFEIIYINEIHENILGHCICKTCRHEKYQNIIGIELMEHREYLQKRSEND